MTESTDQTSNRCDRIDDIRTRLLGRVALPVFTPTGDPIGELVGTILSQHTTDASAAKAFGSLRDRFPTWQSVTEADEASVAEAIRPAGLSNQKTRTIQGALRAIDQEEVSLLGTSTVGDARRSLTSIRGIGDKTASCVLLFALGLPAQPVDTHIERVSKRIGLVPMTARPSSIQDLYEACLPADAQVMHAFHIALIRHGRTVCTARAPKCCQCPILDICDYGRTHGSFDSKPSR